MNVTGKMKVMGEVVKGTAKTGRDYTALDVVVSVPEVDEVYYSDGSVEQVAGESLIPLRLSTRLVDSVLREGIKVGDSVTMDLRVTTHVSEKGFVYPDMFIKSISKIY